MRGGKSLLVSCLLRRVLPLTEWQLASSAGTVMPVWLHLSCFTWTVTVVGRAEDRKTKGQIWWVARPDREAGYLPFHAATGIWVYKGCPSSVPCLHGKAVKLHF